MKKLTVTFALALLGAAVLNTAANAQSASQGDLILGFQATGSTDTAFDFESDLGQYTNFTLLTAGTTVNLTAGLTTAGQTGAFKISDLTGLYGSDTIKGDISGVVPNDPTHGLYITQSASASAPSLDPTNSAYSSIQAMANGFSQGSELGSATDISVAKNDNGVYSEEAGSSGNFGQFSSSKSQTTYSSTGTTVFDLYSAPTGTTGSATEIGYFTLYGASDTTDAGQLTYTALAGAPEPSTYAMMFLGLGALAFIMRRRMAQIG